MKGAESLRLTSGTLMLLISAGAFADSGDLLALNIGVIRKYDENISKVPANGSVGPVENDGSTSTQLNLSLNKQYSMQRLTLKIGLSDNRYDTLKDLNSLGENNSAAWQWQLTPYLSGDLTASHSKSQSDFADFRGSGQNISTVDSRHFGANWQLTGGWSLGAGVANTRNKNSQTFEQNPSSTQDIADANLTYKFPSGSSIALLSSNSRGDQSGAADPATLSDNRFRERHYDLRLNWPFSGVTTLSGGLGQVRRTQGAFSYTLFSGNAALNWAATGKTQFTLTLSRIPESWQQINSSYSIRDRAALAGSWSITPKVSMRANASWEERSFGGEIPGQPSNDRIDKTLLSSLGIDWAAYTKIRLGASISKERRRSTVDSNDYHSRAATLSANIEF